MTEFRPMLRASLLFAVVACDGGPTPRPTTPAPVDSALCEDVATVIAPLAYQWDGDSATCLPGTPSDTYNEAKIARINGVRDLVGVPRIVTLDPSDAQACALTLTANDSIAHVPGPDWSCVTAASTGAMLRSLTGDRSSLELITASLIDPGNPDTLGHRRWLVSPWLQAAALGASDDKACLDMAVDPSASGPSWTAWPPPGDTPLVLLEVRQFSTDAEGWMLQSDSLDLDGASARIVVDGQSIPCSTSLLLPGLGSRAAIRFVPERPVPVGVEWTVVIDGLDTPLSYSGRKVDCGLDVP